MQVLSSLSGIPFYAPSAGYAPTNGADVSAIASAYQVVSSLQYKVDEATAGVSVIGQSLSGNGSVMSSKTLDVWSEYGYPLGDELSSVSSLEVGITGVSTSYFLPYSAGVSAIMLKPSALSMNYWKLTTADYQSLGLLTYVEAGFDDDILKNTAKIAFSTTGFSAGEWLDKGIPFRSQPPSIFFAYDLPYGVIGMQSASGSGRYVDPYGESFSSVSGVNELPLYVPEDTSVSAIASSYASTYAQRAVSSVSGNYYPTSNPSGFLTAAYTPSFGYDSADHISAIDGSALAGGGGGGSASLPISGTGSAVWQGTSLSGTGTLNYSSLDLRQETEYGASARGVYVNTSISVYAECDPREIYRNVFISPSLINVSYFDGDSQSSYTADIEASGILVGHRDNGTNYSTKYNGSAIDFIEDYEDNNGPQTVATINKSSISAWNAKMDSSAVQSAYASASATQATAQNVLYILLPDGV